MIENLLQYQETDKKLFEIERELGASEEKHETFKAYKTLQAVPEQFSKLDKKAESLVTRLENVMAKEKAVSAALSEINEAVSTCEDGDEAQYMLKKAEELLSEIKALEAEYGAVTAEMNAVGKEYGQIRTSYQSAQKAYAEYGKKYKELTDSKKAETEAIQKELSAAKAKISADLMAKYDAKRKAKIFPVVFEAKLSASGGKCGNCGMELSMKEISDMERGELVECEHCRVLNFKK